MANSEKKAPSGSFNRSAAKWRNAISNNSIHKPEKDRYHLYVAYACPWAQRTLMVRALKGLEDVISVTVVHPVWQRTRPNDPNDVHTGWIFSDPNNDMPLTNSIGLGGPFPAYYEGCEPDPIMGAKSIRDIYEHVGDMEGTRSVPILWDKKLNTIVNNESSEIIRMLNSEFNGFATNPNLNLYPEHARAAIDEVNEWVYPTINNGVYRCGFAKTQEAYNVAIDQLTGSFDKVDSILQKQRYICGDFLTEADIRLFATLLRFEEVYVVYFKTNTRSVASTPSMLKYCREIYQLPGIADTINMEQIKTHYFASHPNLNRWSIIPKGPDFMSLLTQSHKELKKRKIDGT